MRGATAKLGSIGRLQKAGRAFERSWLCSGVHAVRGRLHWVYGGGGGARVARLQSLPNGLVLQDVEMAEGHVEAAQRRHDARAEAAPRRVRRPLRTGSADRVF